MFDLNNFAIDRINRGIMVDAKGSYMWSINQVTDPTLSVTSETADVTDALGSPIVTFNRGKTAEFTANNSLFDLGLYAAQMGREKEIATSAAKLVVPAFETLTIGTSETTKTLAHTPKTDLTEIYGLKGDGTVTTKYVAGETASSTEFVYSQGTITLPTSVVAGDQLLVIYEYDSEEAVAVTGTATDFPKNGKFYLEIIGVDVCDPTNLIYAFIEFPNAKLDANVDVSFASDGNHPFTIRANQAYCDNEKILFRIIIPSPATEDDG